MMLAVGIGIERAEHHPLLSTPTSGNWELPTTSKQLSIGAEDAVSTWKTVVPPPFLFPNLSHLLSLSYSLPLLLLWLTET